MAYGSLSFLPAGLSRVVAPPWPRSSSRFTPRRRCRCPSLRFNSCLAACFLCRSSWLLCSPCLGLTVAVLLSPLVLGVFMAPALSFLLAAFPDFSPFSWVRSVLLLGSPSGHSALLVGVAGLIDCVLLLYQGSRFIYWPFGLRFLCLFLLPTPS